MGKDIYVLSEMADEYAHWSVMLLEAIRQRAAYKKHEARIIGLNDIETLPTDADPVIAMNLSHSWGEMAVDALRRRGMRSIILSMMNIQLYEDINVIALDQHKGAMDAVRYFAALGHRRIAFVANNPRSPNDQQKILGVQEACAELGLVFGDQDVFNFTGNMEGCLEEFIRRCDPYDAVICANDVSAIWLAKSPELAKKKRIPQDLYLLSSGNTLLSQLMEPSITTMTLDYAEVGRVAVDNVIYMRKNPAIACQQTLIRVRMVPGASTEFRPMPPLTDTPPKGRLSLSSTFLNFYRDQATCKVLQAEAALNAMDHTDLELLLMLMRNVRKSDMLERLFISDSTYKYRLRKLIQMAGQENREGLMDWLQAWLSPDMLARYLGELREK